MTGIPYNYGKYIDAKVSMTNKGTVDAGRQMQSPASAGSRGLAKTTQFTNDRTQMQMGNSPIAESMVEIRNILNRIDGVNAPVQEDEAEDIKTKPKYHIYQHLDHARFVLKKNSYRDSDEYEFHDHGTAIDQLIKNKVPGSDTLAQMRQHVPGVDDSEEERNRDLRKMVQIAKDYLINQKNVDDSAMDKPEDSENYKPTQEEESAVQEAGHISPEIKSQGMRDFLDIIIDKDEPNVYDQMDDSAKILYKYNSMTGNKLSREQIDMLTDLRQKDDVEFEKQLTKAGVDLEKLGQVAKQYKDDPYESAVQEAPKDSDIDYAKLMLQISAMKDKIAELPIDDDRKTSALTALGQVEDDLAMDEAYEPFPESDEFDIEEDEDFEEVLGPLGFPEDETELFDAEYRGRKVPLNKPMRGDVKKFKVYVKDPKTGNVKKVNFGHGGTSAKKLGQKTMKIRKSNPKARKSFRARHNCANPGPKTKARYWSCRKW